MFEEPHVTIFDLAILPHFPIRENGQIEYSQGHKEFDLGRVREVDYLSFVFGTKFVVGRN